ncbi:arylesterase [Bosea sp. (in: a-proteobacteria)]|jgi:acyl-CoA thioesterase-1|uniref:arylesterase n=1 Tax=Bosea sp. (in: a-proteobacteria) TaxID=1871050 RepID=UPI0039C87A90
MRRAANRYGRLPSRIQQSPRIWAALLLVFASLGSFLMNSTTHAQTKPLKLVALGDSLSAGYNLPGSAAFPTVLEKMLRDKGIPVEIANAGVSGDTSQGGLERLDWSVPDGTDGVILELGANDALRGVDPALTEKSLDAIVTGLKTRGIPVLLAGMYAPRSNGPDFVARFDAIYPKLAEKHGIILYPFFLDGIAGDRVLNQPDMLHPTAEGVRVIAQRILPTVERFLASLRPRS